MKSFDKLKIKKILIIISSVVGAVIIFLIIYGIGVYQWHWQSLIPYPAAIVDYKIVSYNDWQQKIDQYQKTKSFYAQGESAGLPALNMPSDEMIKEQALEDLIKAKIIERLAKKNKIKITAEEINDAYQELVLGQVKNGEESAEESLQKIYGLSIAEFKNQVIQEYLWRQKLNAKLADGLKPLAEKKAEQVLAEAKSQPSQFEALARAYSEDSTALSGGDMGYIGRGEMVTAYEDTAWQLSVGEISDLIETPAGYYIIKVEDKKKIDGEDEIKIRQIFIKIDLDKLIDENLSSYQVIRLVK